MSIISVDERDCNSNWTMVLNTKVRVKNEAPYRKIYIDYILIAEYINGDGFNEAHALVTILKNEAMSVCDLAEAFGINRATLYNYVNAYDADGLEGLRPSKNYRGKINNELINFIKKLQKDNEKLSYVELNRELAKKFNTTISRTSVKQLIKAELMGYLKEDDEENAFQLTFEDINKETTPLIEDENLETVEIKEDFQTVTYTRYGGYLIYATMIQTLFKEVFEHIDKHLSWKNAAKTWDVKNLIYTYILYFFMGITNLEQSKVINRKELGCLLGEEEAACTKTLKRNMKDLMTMDLPEKIQDFLVKAYIALGYVEIGSLYFDGHFVPYYGNKNIGKGFFTQRRLAVSGHEQYWANDSKGRPVFFISSYGFSRFATAIIELTEKALKYMTEAKVNKTLQIAFDRGGYNKALFSRLTEMSVVWSTWKVGTTKIYNENEFKESFVITTANDEVEYGILYTTHKMTGSDEEIDAAVILNKKLNKQITILYSIPESAKDSYSPIDAVIFLLNRWKQENFFKYALENQDINQTFGLTEGTEEDAYIIPNPEYIDLNMKKYKLANTLGSLALKKEKMKENYLKLKKEITYDDYLKQKLNSKIIDSYEETLQNITELEIKIKTIKAEIPYTKKDGSTYEYINFSKMNLMNALKAAVYNMHWQMRDIAKIVFKDHREVSKLLKVLTETGGHYKTSEEKDVLVLKRLELPAYQVAAEILIAKINENKPMTLGHITKPLYITFEKLV
jgi:transposase